MRRYSFELKMLAFLVLLAGLSVFASYDRRECLEYKTSVMYMYGSGMIMPIEMKCCIKYKETK